jgi:choline dehydrogenase
MAIILKAIASVLLLSSCIIAFPSPDTDTTQTTLNTYDYIVVGSGPGGGPLASNLTLAGASVLLLEAGDDQGANLDEEIAG